MDNIIEQTIAKMKIEKAGRASAMSAGDSTVSDQTNPMKQQSEVELEIDSNFFSGQVLPKIHKVMMSNVKIDSKNFFNFVLSLRLALMYNSMTIEEHNHILNQLI